MSIFAKKFYGKYRGTVINNIDPEQKGRLLVEVPEVGGLVLSTWAMPCFPVAGKEMGVYVIPQIGAGVWVEYEQGNPDYPIWVGCWWGSVAEVPPLALAGDPATPNILLQTTLQNTILMSDTIAGIMLKSNSGATVLLSPAGIEIQNGQGASITMTGPTINIIGEINITGATNITGETNVTGPIVNITGETNITGPAANITAPVVDVTGVTNLNGDTNINGVGTIDSQPIV